MNKNFMFHKFANKVKSKVILDLLEKEILHPVDILYSNRYSNLSEKSSLFLAYLLSKAREGHICASISANKIVPSISSEIDPMLIKGAQDLSDKQISNEIVHVNGKWYLRKNWECENAFLVHWKRLSAMKPDITFSDNLISSAIEKMQMEEEQKRAIFNASKFCLSLICGGPGTGKTYTAAVCMKTFLKLVPSLKIALAAPTGKAAANLRSALGNTVGEFVVSTLHSLLKKNRELSYDIVLIDEGSMVDAQLMTKLFTTIKEGSRLIILGDHNQLPPVESGNFFADLIKGKPKNVTQLGRCLRAELFEIVEMAENVKQGIKIPFQLLPKPNELLEKICEKFPFSEEWDDKVKNTYQQFRVLSPLRHGPYGVDELNRQLYQRHLREANKSQCKRIGIPIMISRNDPSIGLFNGDTGFLIKDGEKEYAIFSDSKRIPIHLLPTYEYAYLSSIHKSQGSEYDEVIVLLPEGAENFGRELLYTAITRGKKRVVLFAKELILEAILEKATLRISGFDFFSGK